jgi:GTPase SAR1 family protein
MFVLSNLQLDQNEKLVTPPREILQHGLPAIREYLGALRAGKVTRTIARVMFVGWASAGKTKLNHALRGTLSEWRDESTVGIDTSRWLPGWAGAESDSIEFRSWDFAGQQEYYSMHRIFLSERAIYLLLVDLSKPAPDLDDPEDTAFVKELRRTVHFWLNSLTKSTKGVLVQVVATKVDLLEEARVGARVQLLLDQLLEEERVSCADFKAQLDLADEQGREKAQEALNNRPSLPKTVGDILLSSLPQAAVERVAETVLEEPSEDHELPPFSIPWGPSGVERLQIQGNKGESWRGTLRGAMGFLRAYVLRDGPASLRMCDSVGFGGVQKSFTKFQHAASVNNMATIVLQLPYSNLWPSKRLPHSRLLIFSFVVLSQA